MLDKVFCHLKNLKINGNMYAVLDQVPPMLIRSGAPQLGKELDWMISMWVKTCTLTVQFETV